MPALMPALMPVLMLVTLGACRPESHGQPKQVLVPPDAPLVHTLRPDPASRPRVELPADQRMPRGIRADATYGVSVQVPTDHEPRVLRVEPHARVEVPLDEVLPRAIERRAQP